jgi:hypothetical protein
MRLLKPRRNNRGLRYFRPLERLVIGEEIEKHTQGVGGIYFSNFQPGTPVRAVD